MKSQTSAPDQLPSIPPIKVAVVGLGIGQSHLRAYQQLMDQFEVVAVCDLDADKARAVAAEYEIPRVFTDLDALCMLDEVDVIDICTPPFLHAEHVLQVLDAGKHAICEKPLVASLADIDRLAAAEAKSGMQVMPIFNYRFGHGLQKLRHLMAEGLAGKAYLSTIEVAWRRGADYYAVPWRGKWETELGGALVGHAIHALDMLLYVIGPAKSVYARTATRVNPIEVEDCASVSLEMADGSLASVSVTLGSSAQITRQRYCFRNLTAESNLEPYAENSAEPWQFTPDTPELAAQVEASLSDFMPQPESFTGQFARFHQALQTGGELPVTLSDARHMVELLTATYHSARTGAAVSLPLSSDHPTYGGWLPPA